MPGLDVTPIEQFFASSARSQWIQISPYDIYVRKAHHAIDNAVCKCVDLANVVNTGPMQGNRSRYAGFWSIFSALQQYGRRYEFTHLYLENTHNIRLYHAYLQRKCIPVPNAPYCLYKRL